MPPVQAPEKILGVSFFNGTAAEAVDEMDRAGGLLVSPVSPALLKLRYDEDYRRALQQANLAIPDSSLLVLLWKIATGRALRKLSGLGYLKCLLRDAAFRKTKLFWVVSSEQAKQRAVNWLSAQGLGIDQQNCYVWTAGPGQDYPLLAEIESRRPDHIVIATTGAGQEKLGLYLRDYLVYRPKIHCVGAALGFLTGAERPIPEWAERFHLGWLFRLMAQPRMIIP